MRLRLPSFGFCYLAVALAAVPGFVAYVERPFFFELPVDSPLRQAGEARYLLELASACADERRLPWLRDGLQLALAAGALDLVDAAVALGTASGLPSAAIGLREIEPGGALVHGLDADGCTDGDALATFVLRNAGERPRRFALRFSTLGDGRIRRVVAGDTTWLSLDGPGPRREGRVTSPPVPPGARVLVAVGAASVGTRDSRTPGLKFEQIEVLP